MVAVGGRDKAAALSWLKVVLAHQALDLLVVHDQALLPQGDPDTPPAILLELVADGRDRLDDCSIVPGLNRRP